MKNNKNEENLALLINVSDSLSVQAKMTFESCTIDGIQATYWGEDEDQIEEKINRIFDILFDEMIKVEETKLITL